MGKATVSIDNANKPAPRWWRKLENGLLMLLIPSAVGIIQGIKFDNEALATKLTLFINVGLVAIIKFITVMLANGEEYTSGKDEQSKTE